MFEAKTYRDRRARLYDLAREKPLVFPSNPDIPRNYRANTIPGRQNSHLLWLSGLLRNDLWLVLHDGESWLFAPAEDPDDLVWHGPSISLQELADRAGIDRLGQMADLSRFLVARGGGKLPGYLPPYRAATSVALAEACKIPLADVGRRFDAQLAARMVQLRGQKSSAEIAEIERALEVTHEQHLIAMRMARPGLCEQEIVAAMLQPALARGLDQAYNPIVSVRGEVLHNHAHDQTLVAGQLLLNDSGVESTLGYASDITRVVPVSPRFSPEQKAIYEVVLAAELQAIERLAPGVPYREVHLLAAQVLAEGLVDLGLLRGKASDIVAAGAHAAFFPHGVGHMLGLDVHDMEDLGDLVGYGGEGLRSAQFGLNFLRLARPLEVGNVVTIEPGFYVIESLLKRFFDREEMREFIDFDRAFALKPFGGIRIEDDVLITATGHRVLGPKIPKTVEEIEALRL